MALADDLKDDVKTILYSRWTEREGRVVPDTEDLKLGNDAVKLDGTVLYADLAESTALVDSKKRWFAAEIYKCYLRCACKIIRDNGGEITAFDGDRVMSVFVGSSKNTNSVKTALKINYAVKKIINPLIKEKYPDVNYEVRHAVGIDTSDLFVAKTGIRDSNDLVWVGPAANYAAKLCSLREDANSSWISARIFNNIANEAKYGGTDNRLMWEARTWTKYNQTVYCSNWTWTV